MLVSATHKKAVKASLAQLVGSEGHTPRMAALVVQYAQERLMLQVGDLASMDAKISYAYGVYHRDERASNKRWTRYDDATQSLVNQIVATQVAMQTDGFYAA